MKQKQLELLMAVTCVVVIVSGLTYLGTKVPSLPYAIARVN